MHSLSKAQRQVLEEKLDYLIDASARLGRKDWLIIFMGTILSFVLTATFAQSPRVPSSRRSFAASDFFIPSYRSWSNATHRRTCHHRRTDAMLLSGQWEVGSQ